MCAGIRGAPRGRHVSKRKGLEAYRERNELLRSMGYPSYTDYLASDLWKRIRRKVFARTTACEVCGTQKATQVHHRSYIRPVLTGHRLDLLVACCRTCHETCEFDGTRKAGMSETNTRMSKLALRNKKVLPFICRACRSNPTKPQVDRCGRCVRENRPCVV